MQKNKLDSKNGDGINVRVWAIRSLYVLFSRPAACWPLLWIPSWKARYISCWYGFIN